MTAEKRIILTLLELNFYSPLFDPTNSEKFLFPVKIWIHGFNK